MRRKELFLDFTSLLDVIMILLFVVLANVSQTSTAATKKAEDALADTTEQLQQKTNENENLVKELEETQAENYDYQKLQDEYDKLLKDFNYLKVSTNYDPDDTSVYVAALERTGHVIVNCESIASDTEKATVKLQIYVCVDSEGQQTLAGETTFEHDLTLTKAQRAEKSAQDVTQLTMRFSDVLHNLESPIIWFSVEYRYDDEDIADSDIETIRKAIEGYEKTFSKKCYIEEAKKY